MRELRKKLGSDDPRTLVALASLIRLRTATGDVESGAELFDELVGLDLQTSPVLAHATPPVKLTRHLGGLGELSAARRQLEASLAGGMGPIGVEFGFADEAKRALDRLRVALGEVSDEELATLDLTPGPTASMDIPIANRPSIGKRDWTFQPPKEFWSAGMAGHELFDSTLGYAPKSGLETAERLRATANPGEVSLLTRIRRHGSLVGEADNFGGAAWRPGSSQTGASRSGASRSGASRSRTPLPGIVQPDPVQSGTVQAGGPPQADDEMLDFTVLIQALTRALDRVPSDDPRAEAMLEERARLQRERSLALNAKWDSVEQTYIPTTLRGLQRTLDQGTLVLYYMAAGDHTDLIVIPARGEATSHRIELGIDGLEREIASFLDDGHLGRARGVGIVEDEDLETESGPSADPADVSRRLYGALLAPAQNQIEDAARLLIIPDGPLHKLPFAALQLPTGNYLAESKPLAVAPSAAAFIALAARRDPELGDGEDREVSGSLLAFGDPAYGPSGDDAADRTLPFAVRSAVARGFSGALPPLPGSGREVQEIGEIFENHGLAARVHKGADATEKSAKEEIGAANYVHFAAHGVVDGDQPEHSFLALALPAMLSEGEENGIVEGWEIMDDMQTSAELVALSACETSLGEERSGEGPSSLNRAFLAAGARSVLSALWKVDDAATSELMIRFYRHLTDGRTKAESLRLAQVELIESSDLGFQAPIFWAAFQLTGDWQ